MFMAGLDSPDIRRWLTDAAIVTKGYAKLLEALGGTDVLVCTEATGHYWKNLFVTLTGHGFKVALVNPLRTHRFMGEDLARTKTDAIDALGLAKFAAQKRPNPAPLPDEAYEQLVRRRRNVSA